MNDEPNNQEEWMSPAESWAWGKLLSGHPANMVQYHEEMVLNASDSPASVATLISAEGSIEPIEEVAWSEHQYLTAEFLFRVCTDQNLRAKMTRSRIDIRNARFLDAIDLSDEVIDGSLSLYDCRLDNGLNLLNTNVRGSLNLQGSHVCADAFGQSLQCGRLKTSGYVFLRRRGLYDGEVHFTSAEIYGSVQLTGSSFKGTIEFPSVFVRDDLILDDSAVDRPPPEWSTATSINLKNARIGAIQSSFASWLQADKTIILRNLDGLRCQRLSGGFGGESLEHASSKELLRWVRDRSDSRRLSPQKYLTVANALKLAGFDEKATQVRIALARDRTRVMPSLSIWKWIRLLLIGPVTAYGYRPYLGVFWFFAVVVFFAFVGLGWSILHHGQHEGLTWVSLRAWFGFSLETAFPIFELDPVKDDFLVERFVPSASGKVDSQLPGYLRAVFMAERIIGILLLSTLVASLAGWAEKKGEE